MTLSQQFPDVTQRRIETNGITLNIAEQGDGPLVLLLHGFPESWFSWRHQFNALSEAGFRAVAPDMRGYGDSDKPNAIEAYNQVEVVNDIIGLIPALGYERARELASNPVGGIVLLGILALPVWKGAHHVRHFFIDRGHAEKDGLIGGISYAVATLLSLAAVFAVARLQF